MTYFNILKKSLVLTSSGNEPGLKRVSEKLFLAILGFASLMAMPFTSNAQYLEQFSTPNKGYLPGCTSDFTGVNWSMTAWNPGGTCQPGDSRDSDDYFQTNASGVLEANDLDEEVCWQSPLINISAAGTVSLSVDLVWNGFDIDGTLNNCINDQIKVMYSINGGPYTMVPNQFGGSTCATVAYPQPSSPPPPAIGMGTVTQGSISGNTLQIRVCVFNNTTAEKVTIDNVSVPQAGVTVGCAPPVLSTVLTQVGCSNPNSGAINLSVSAGTPPYTYDWSNNGAQNPDTDPEDLNGLPVGPYTVTVTDAASCTATTSVNITNAPALALSTQVLGTNCAGTMDGEIGLDVSGGVPGYTYDWSNNGAQNPDTDPQDLIGVGAGSYTVTVTDASGCTATTNATVGTLPAVAYNEQFNVANKGYLANFMEDFSAVNWTMSSWAPQPPAGFGRDSDDFFRTSGGVLVGEDFDQEVCWTSPLIGMNTATQFSVGLAWTNFDNEDYINVKYSIDGGAYVTLPNALSNGAAGTIQYPSPTLDQSSSTTVTKTGLSGSTIQIQVCGNFNSESITIDNVSVPNSTTYCPAPEISLTPTNVTCVGGVSGNNGSIQVTASDGLPGYNVSWSGPSSGNPTGTEIATSGGSYNITGLAPGTYNVTVTGANAITATSSVTLTLAPVFSIGNQVYNDVNRNGIFDGGDLGINGVALNLYLDVNSNNMLDAGDGAAVAMATTANISGQDGRYAFNSLCPATYIVQVAPSNFSMSGALYNAGAPFVSSPLSGAGDPDVDLDDNDDNGDPVSGFGVATAAFAVAANNNNIDFGFKIPAQISINDVTLAEGSPSGTTTFTFTVSRPVGQSEDAVTLTVNTNDATAVSPGDFTAISSTVTLPATVASTTIDVLVNKDVTVEADETFTLLLTAPPAHAVLTDGSGLGAITNDDNTTLTLSQPAGASQNEGNMGTTPFVYRMTLSNPVQGGFRVNYTTNNGTATTADSDYADNDAFIDFTGTAGEFHEFTVNVTGDTKVEADETIQTEMVSLSLITVNPANVSFSGSPFTSTILNDDVATLTIAPVSQNEGTGGTTDFNFAVTLNPAVQGGFGLNFMVNDGTATDADDFDVITTSPLAFAGTPGETHNIVVRVTADNKVEASEAFTVQLVSLSLISVDPFDVTFSGSPATGAIQNDDAATVTLTPANILMQNEGNTGTTPFVFTATLNNPVQGGFTVPYTTSDGLATTANNDYQDNDGMLTFLGNMGENFQITVLVNGDFIVEANEGFTVALGAISGAPAGVSVVGSPQSGLIVNDEIDFGDAPDSYGTLLPGGARHGTSLIVRLGATSDGEADGQPGALADGDDTDAEGDDDDGVTLPSALVINTTANISIEASINGFVNGWVDFNGNGNFNEPGELVFNQQAVVAGVNALSFAVPAGATVGSSFARFRFTQDAVPAVPTGLQTTGEVEDYAVNIANTQFSINDPLAVAEGNAGTTDLIFTVSRSNTSNACSVEFMVTGGSATISDGDFTVITPSPINFTAGGSPTASVIVRVNGDTKVELDETVEINLSNPVNGSILDGLGMGTINNDDLATLSITSPALTEGDAGTQNMTFDLNLSNPSDTNVVVNFATMNGSATTADLDYQNNSGSHTFLSGQTSKQVVVLINGDCKIEPNEQFTVQLSSLNANGRSVILSGGGSTLSGTGTINNNDAAPVITCPGPITISCTASQLPANTGMATATDNCAPITFGYTDVITPGSCAGNYTIARTWKATDNTNDMSTCVQTITVVDNTPPTPVCLTNTVFLGAGGAYTLQASDVLNMNATTDNCGTVSVFSITPATVTCAQLNQTINVVVVVKDDCGNSAQCTASITVQEDTDLPSGWNTTNVGNANGSSIFSPCTGNNGAFVLTSTGFSTSSSDVLHAAFQQICGNATVTARIASVSGGGWGGVMIRENLAPGSKKVSMKTQLTTNIRREIRSVTNGAAAILNYIRPGHTWLRLERSGGNFVGYSSPDGVSWSFAFTAPISMTGCVYVGIFSESINNSVTNTATFDNVSITGTPIPLVGNFNQLPVAESGDEVQIYPNPTTGELNIDLDVYAGKPGVVQVFNVLGELVTQEHLVAGNMEIHNLRIEGSAGVYTVVVQLDEHRIVRRVVVDPNGGK